MANQFKGTPVTTHDAERVNVDIKDVNGNATTNGLPIDDTDPIQIDLVELGGTAISNSNPIPVTNVDGAGAENVYATNLVNVSSDNATASTATATAIPASTQGQLRRVTISGSAGCEAEIKDGAGATVGYLCLNHGGGSESENFFGTSALAAATQSFTVDVTNFDDDDDVDFKVNIHWSEFAV